MCFMLDHYRTYVLFSENDSVKAVAMPPLSGPDQDSDSTRERSKPRRVKSVRPVSSLKEPQSHGGLSAAAGGVSEASSRKSKPSAGGGQTSQPLSTRNRRRKTVVRSQEDSVQVKSEVKGKPKPKKENPKVGDILIFCFSLILVTPEVRHL